MWILHSTSHHLILMEANLSVALEVFRRWRHQGWDVKLELRDPSPEDLTALARLAGALEHPSRRRTE